MNSDQLDVLDTYQQGDVPFLNIVVKYGVIGVLILILLAVIRHFFAPVDLNDYEVGTAAISTGITILQNIVYVIVMIFAVREYKSKNGGFMSFLKGLIVAYLTGLLMAVVMFFVNVFLSYMVIDTDMQLGFVAMASIISFVSNCFFGVGVASLVSLAFRREKPIGFNFDEK